MRFAICNEMFGDMAFGRAAECVARAGFQGIELAPFTLFGDFSAAAMEQGMRTIRKGLADAGLAFAGMHWLFLKPDGLHITSRDPDIRHRSWDHLNRLIDVVGELGGGNMILGSPRQRAARGIPRDEAMRYFLDGLADAGNRAAQSKAMILIEALPAVDTNIINTLADVSQVLHYLDSPGLSGMFDFHNTTDETETWEKLIEQYRHMIRHVHLNTKSGAWPNEDCIEFFPSFALLKEKGYQGWVSLEVFSVPEHPEKTLSDTRAFLDKAMNR